MSLRHVPLLLLALLLAPVGVLSAQEDAGHRAEPPSAPDPVSVEPAPPDVSEPSSPPETPDTPVESPEAPAEPATSESPSGRYAVPVDTLPEPHRQPPHRGGHPPGGGGGGGDDGGYVPPTEIESDELYDESVVTGGWPFGIGRGRREDGGALDLDVSPGRTQVYLNGEYVGIVDQYDGWPSHLWLEEGAYEIVFYLDGYRTLARRVIIHPGLVIKIDDRLEPGPSIRPEEFFRQ